MSALLQLEAHKFEEALREGDRVLARWTNSFHYHSAHGVVVRVNEKSVRVKIDEPASYMHGRTLTVPRATTKTWSMHNRLEKPREVL